MGLFQQASPRRAKNIDKVNLLILDSSPMGREVYEAIVRELGFTEIRVMHNGYDVVQLMRSVQVDMMLVDVGMRLNRHEDMDKPAINGIDLVQRLRHSPRSPNPFVPVIMTVEEGNEAQRKAAMDSGVNDVLNKPMEVRALCNSIQELVHNPRQFVSTQHYRGPCRRRALSNLPPQTPERCNRNVCLIQHSMPKSA